MNMTVFAIIHMIAIIFYREIKKTVRPEPVEGYELQNLFFIKMQNTKKITLLFLLLLSSTIITASEDTPKKCTSKLHTIMHRIAQSALLAGGFLCGWQASYGTHQSVRFARGVHKSLYTRGPHSPSKIVATTFDLKNRTLQRSVLFHLLNSCMSPLGGFILSKYAQIPIAQIVSLFMVGYGAPSLCTLLMSRINHNVNKIAQQLFREVFYRLPFDHLFERQQIMRAQNGELKLNNIMQCMQPFRLNRYTATMHALKCTMYHYLLHCNQFIPYQIDGIDQQEAIELMDQVIYWYRTDKKLLVSFIYALNKKEFITKGLFAPDIMGQVASFFRPTSNANAYKGNILQLIPPMLQST